MVVLAHLFTSNYVLVQNRILLVLIGLSVSAARQPPGSPFSCHWFSVQLFCGHFRSFCPLRADTAYLRTTWQRPAVRRWGHSHTERGRPRNPTWTGWDLAFVLVSSLPPFILVGLGFELRAVHLAKQALYHLSHSSIHLTLVILEMGSWTICLDWP
jgi:hypothetical protein